MKKEQQVDHIFWSCVTSHVVASFKAFRIKMPVFFFKWIIDFPKQKFWYAWNFAKKAQILLSTEPNPKYSYLFHTFMYDVTWSLALHTTTDNV